MGKTHIFVAGKNDLEIFFAAKEDDELVWWAVPTSAKFGDKGVFLLPDYGFVAVGTVESHPEENGNRFTRWAADIKISYPFKAAVPLQAVQNRISHWAQIQTPHVWMRSFTIDFAYLDEFIRELKRSQSSMAEEIALERALF